jgi:hypothetical protein
MSKAVQQASSWACARTSRDSRATFNAASEWPLVRYPSIDTGQQLKYKYLARLLER